jgi:hypothetical protein
MDHHAYGDTLAEFDADGNFKCETPITFTKELPV